MKVSNAPLPLFPLPTVMLTAPDLPPVLAPEPILMDPVEPELALPELNTSMPLTPLSPALPVRIESAPDVLDTL